MPMWCVYVHTCACPPYATVNWELEDSLQEIWVLGLNSGDQSWLQVPFPLSHLASTPKNVSLVFIWGQGLDKLPSRVWLCPRCIALVGLQPSILLRAGITGVVGLMTSSSTSITQVPLSQNTAASHRLQKYTALEMLAQGGKSPVS